MYYIIITDSYIFVKGDLMDIGARLVFLLKEKHITQKSLAERSGLTPSYINQICNGKKVPTLDALGSLCDALSISISDFFSDKSETAPARLTTREHQLIENFRSLYDYEQDFFFDMVKNLRQKHRQALNTMPISVWRNTDGYSAAGSPLFDATIDSCVQINPKYRDPERYKIICVRGNSMEPDISNGDFVVVARYTQADQGNIALVHLESDNSDGEYTIKKFYHYGDHAELRSINPECQTMVYPISSIISAEKIVDIIHQEPF